MWVKICGVTRSEDARVIRDAGAHAIGLNFFPGSRRVIEPDVAAQIVIDCRLPADALKAEHPPLHFVGVFVNAPVDTIVQTVLDVGLDAVQFHGDESIDDIAAVGERLAGIRMIRAVRVNRGNQETVLEQLDQLLTVVPVSSVLLDACVPGQYGGTGHTVDLQVLRAFQSTEWMPKIILAGGLTPENVQECVRQSQPWGVDTASGVETGPGVKDPDRVRQFIRAAQKDASPQRRETDLL